MRANILITSLLTLPGAFFAPVIHESVKAMCSARLGDPTPKRNGFLSRNPFKYFETVGFLCMLIFGYGWGQPVPTSPMYYKDSRRGVLITYITPSVVNLLIGIITSALMGISGGAFVSFIYNAQTPEWLALTAVYAWNILSSFARFNIALALFNILPVYPLDGAKILQLYLKPDWAIRVNQYEKILQLVLIVFLGMGFIERVFGPITNWILNAMVFK